jgi:hypothetical protein
MAKTTDFKSTLGDAVTVTSAFTDIFNHEVTGYTFSSIQVTNTGSAAFTGFKVQAKDCISDAEWYDYILGADLDCKDTAGASLDITTLAAADVAHLEIPIGSKYRIRLVATCASSTTAYCVGTFASGSDGTAIQSLLATLGIIARVSSTVSDETVEIGAGNTAVLAVNTSRHFATFVNDGSESVYLQLAATAAMNTGIRLNANGGSYTISTINLYSGAVSAISASGGNVLTVQEA